MFNTLIQAPVLHDNLETKNWVIVDCRASLADADYGRTSFASYHIPGARRADLETDLSGAIIAGISGRHPLPEREQLTMFLQGLGVNAQSQLITYDDGNSAFAARFWWLARWMGLQNVAVLDGGLKAYQEHLSQAKIEARPVLDPQRQRSTFTPRKPLTRIREASYLESREPDCLLIDARSESRFRGEQEPIDFLAGHIPGAVCLPFEENLDDKQHFKSAEQLRSRFQECAAGYSEIVCYCGSGVTAAHNILAMQIAGLGESALYPGSWSEWIQDPDRLTEPPRSSSD